MPQENNGNIRRVVKRFAMSLIATINMGWRETLQLHTLEGDSHNETFSLPSLFKDIFWCDMTWYMTWHDMTHDMTYDTWHTTYDIWHDMIYIWYDTIRYDMIYDIRYIYLLQLSFYPVAVVGILVKNRKETAIYKRRNNTQNNKKHRKEKIEN
jgi:hypothetical protein